MKRGITFIASALIFCSTLDGQVFDPSQYRELVVEKEFKPLLASMLVQMETGGAKIFKQPDGSLWLVSIGLTTVKPETATELLRRRTVAKAKALANAVAELNGTQVKSTVIMTTKDKVIVHDGVESGITDQMLDETIVTEAKGLVKGLPVIASWLSKNGEIYFLALGKKLK